MNNSSCSIDLNHVTKSYAGTKALDRITLRLEENQIYGLFGRNGAGKSTLMDIIATNRFPTEGDLSVTINNGRVQENSSAVMCYMPEEDRFPAKIKVKALLDLAAASYPFYDFEYAQKLCRVLKLDTGKRYSELSRGHQSYVRIIIGLASNAPLTLLDEPVLGLDAAARDLFYSLLIETYSENPRLILISTHFIDESSDLFGEAVILHEGRVILHKPGEALLSGVFWARGRKEVIEDFTRDAKVISRESSGNVHTMLIELPDGKTAEAEGITFTKPTVQEFFIKLTDNRPVEEEIE